MKNMFIYAYFVKEVIKSIPEKRRISKLKDPIMQKKESFLFAQRTCRRIFEKIGVTIDISGMDNVPYEKDVVFVSNHQGNFDILALLVSSPIPISFISKKELKKLPVISGWMELIDCVFIDRKKGKESILLLKRLFHNYHNQSAFVLFPEGTRSKSSTLNPFKKGGLKVALSTEVQVVPITIDGTYLIMEENQNKIKPAHVRVHFHPPMRQEKMSTDVFIEEIRGTIQGKLETF